MVLAAALPTRRYRALIDAAALVAGIPTWGDFPAGVWVEGLVMQESSGRPAAIRYEPHQDRAGRKDAATDGDAPDFDNGMSEDDKSFGLMQCMGYNARRIVGVPDGTPMRFEWALDPLFGIALGLEVLRRELTASGGNVALSLARYNGGPSGNPGADGSLRTQHYVDGVKTWAARVREDRRNS